MSYTDKDYMSKKQIKDDLKAGENITCYNPGLGPDLSNFTGTVFLEGPHYPKPHKWHGKGYMENGLLKKIF